MSHSKKPAQLDPNALASHLANASRGFVHSAPQTLLTGDLGAVILAGAAGVEVETLGASDVVLVSLLVDASSSIHSRGLEDAIREGQNRLLDTFEQSRLKHKVLVSLVTFNDEVRVHHGFVPVDQATRLDAKNYAGCGGTRLYDTFLAALASDLAYAERLRASGTTCRSLVVVLTDGEDAGSKHAAAECGRMSQDVLATERTSLAFVGVGKDIDYARVAATMGFPKGSVGTSEGASPDDLRRLFRVMSQAIIAHSLGRVGPPGGGFFSP